MAIEIKLRYVIPIITFLVLACIVKSQEVRTGNLTISATVGQWISISLSQELNSGIRFGQVSPGTNNKKAIGNSGSESNYSIMLDPSSTSSVNLWHKASGNLCYQTNCILIANLTHEANTESNSQNLLGNDGNYPLTTSYTKIGGESSPCGNLPAGSSCYLAFWLDVPSGIPSGNYQTTYTYCANATAGNAICE